MFQIILILGVINLNIQKDVTFKIYKNADKTFGYDILKDSKIFIHQPTIPAMIGTKGFIQKKSAINVAALVVYKIEHGILPPSVSHFELDSLKAY